MENLTPIAKPWHNCPPDGRLLRLPEILERTGLSRSQVYEMIASGEFPPLIKLSRRAAALPEAWLDCFVAAKAEQALMNAR